MGNFSASELVFSGTPCASGFEGTMVRSASLASVVIAILGFCNVGYSQTSITRFEDVAGKWAGHASPHDYSVTLEIERSGKFNARSPLGSERGEAKLDGGVLVIPLADHKGMLQLVLDGQTLRGPGVLRGRTWMVSLVRADRMAEKD
jgi:hypothetical protein